MNWLGMSTILKPISTWRVGVESQHVLPGNAPANSVSKELAKH